MMSRTRLVAVALAALMVSTALLSVSPVAAAQDFLPTKPDVPLVPLPKLEQRLYLRFADVDNPANAQAFSCTEPGTLRLQPATPASNDVNSRTCPYVVSGVGNDGGVSFTTPPELTPNRAFNFTGNDSFRYHHRGSVPAGVSIKVEVRSGQTALAEGTLVGEAQRSTFTVPMNLVGQGAITNNGQVNANAPIEIVLTATNTGTALATGWQLTDVGSYLEMRAQDAVRVATWVTNERDELRDVFAPITNESRRPEDEGRRVVGHFAIQSALGISDADTRGTPVFHVLRGGRSYEIGAGGVTAIPAVRNLSAGAPLQGLAVWSFEPGALNYRGLPGGEWAVRVEATLHGGTPITQGIEKRFAISTQGVTLAPYEDARNPALKESQAHTVLAGGTTTYLLAVANNGSVNDTFSINVSATNAPAGWGFTVGGPDVLGRRIAVPAGETRVFTVTVSAPFSGTGQVIHIVNVTSTLDPGARSSELPLVTTIGTEVSRDVGIVFLPRNLEVEPGVNNLYSVYVWNRGTRVANVSLEIQSTLQAPWQAQLMFGNAGVGRLVVSGIQPGAIGEAQLRVISPASGTPVTQLVRLNATNLDVQGISRELDLTFALRQLAGVRVQVLQDVAGVGHVVEIANDGDADDPSCRVLQQCNGDEVGDGVNGIWFRVWVTNTGRTQDTFQLSATDFRKSQGARGCTSLVFPSATTGNPMGGAGNDFNFFSRSSSGALSGPPSMTLEPGQTAEAYIFLPSDPTAPLCLDAQRNVDFYSFVVQASSQQTGALGRAPAEAIARNNDGSRQNGVYLENVARRSNGLVDINNASSRLVLGAAVPGETVLYRVRLTHLASWGEFTQSNVLRRPLVNVSVIGTEGERDWNISVRQVKDNFNDANYDEVNPWARSVEISNKNPTRQDNRREAWFDTEIEVRVEAPANGTAATNARAEFSLLAQAVGADAKSTLEMTTIIADKAQINVTATPTRALAHPGRPGAFLLTLSNVGGSATTVTLQASMTQNGWQVSPNSQSFSIAPFTNRTVALLATPPVSASQGQSAEVQLNITYFDRPETFPNSTARALLATPLVVEVVPPGSLQLTVPTNELTIPPGGMANFTMSVRNAGSSVVPFRAVATPIPNWTVSASPASGDLQPGESRTVVVVLIAPVDVKNDTRFSTVFRISEDAAPNNFDSAALHVNILGGRALPGISVPTFAKRVDRAGVQSFEVAVQNIGTAAGRIPLEVRAQEPNWVVGLVDQRGNNVTALDLQPNQVQVVNVTVRAPFSVPERTVVPIEIIAYSQDLTQAAKATLSAEIHDYGVELAITPSSKEGLPGVPTEFTLRVKNTGNDNDTLNVSVNLVDLPEWTVELSNEEVRLEPGQAVDLRATIRSPMSPLPAARSYTFPFWVGTRGGQAVDIIRNQTAGAVLTIPNYRAHDVDRDGNLEIAADLDRRAANGFEVFREITTTGAVTQVVASPLFEGRTTFFLDIPGDGRPYDGVADVWFNPETVHAFAITHTPDLNGDGSPDYLLDTDRDGRLDKAFDSGSERFWEATEVRVFGDERLQYLIDITGDGRPDRFFDPETGRVTRTQAASNIGADTVGIDVDDDDRVDYYYNTRTRETSTAEVQNVGSFARQYWYFFVVFALLALLTVMLIVRRRRA